MSPYNIRYCLREVSYEQREQWEQFVTEHPHGHVLQSWSWGDVKARTSWHPLRLALWDQHIREIVAVAQVLRRTAAHVPLWAGHLAYIPRGPVLDWSQPAHCEAFFSQLTQHLRYRGAIALRLESDLEPGSTEGELALKYLNVLHAHPTQTVQPLRTIMLDLTSSEEVLLAQMKEKWRYNVRLGGRKGVKVRIAETVEDVRAWYQLLQTTSERDQFGIHTLAYYLSVWEIFGQRGQGRLFLAEHEGHLLAGIFVGLCARLAVYLYGASSNEQRQLMPNYVLQWEAIRWAKSQGATRYDFWGIPVTDAEDEDMAGVYRFKSGWGGRVVQYIGGYELIYRPLTMRIVQRFI